MTYVASYLWYHSKHDERQLRVIPYCGYVLRQKSLENSVDPDQTALGQSDHDQQCFVNNLWHIIYHSNFRLIRAICLGVQALDGRIFQLMHS